jgi:hypothetical protein
LKDLDNGYFPAPWAMLPHPSLEGVNYGEIPRRVCGADPSWEWHPYLGFSNEEREMAKDFCGSLPHAKTVMLETAILSAGGHFSDEFVRKIMQQCRDKWGKCNFIFASKITQQTKVGDYSALIDDKGVVSASQFTVRQMGLVYDYCDLFLGISSGITVAVSRWGGKPVPKVVETNDITDYSFMANGVSNPVICNDLRQQAKEEKFMPILMHTLSQI